MIPYIPRFDPIDWEQVRLIARLTPAQRLNLMLDARALAVAGGEDYELLFTCAPDSVARIRTVVAEAGGLPVTQVGEITAGAAIIALDSEGHVVPLAGGFDHFASRRS